jgi:hypothetical protein
MMTPLRLSRFGTTLVVVMLLGSTIASAPARAASFTVFWDAAAFGPYPSGYGVSQTTAQSANSAGIPIVSFSGLVGWNPNTLPINRTLDISTLTPPFPIGSTPATITANWSATNNTGLNNGTGPTQNLYLVFERPVTNDQFFVNGQQQLVTYNPADVGLTLTNDGSGSGVDWVILQVPVANNNAVYYPAVSLGPLANGAATAFPLFYTLNNPQVFTENFNYALGMPKWSLDFVTNPAPIPEPSSGLLMLVGLLGIAGGRRKQS